MTYKIVVLNPQDILSPRTLDRISQFFGLSGSESAAIAAVIALQPLSEYSRVKGVQQDTVRKQLKSAMTKMAVNSQKQLFQVYERFKVFSDSPGFQGTGEDQTSTCSLAVHSRTSKRAWPSE